MAGLHLWFNGDDHAPGETEADATAYLVRVCGITSEEAEGDGWVMIPDDKLITDEDGKAFEPPLTAVQWATDMAAEAARG